MKKLKTTINPRLSLENTYDRIHAFYLTGRKINDRDEDVRKRWEAAYALLCNFHSYQQAATVLAASCNPKISIGQAYRDLKNATRLFGDVTESSKEGFKFILLEYSMRCFQLAAKSSNVMEMNKSIANMIKIKGLDKEDPSSPLFENLQQNIFNIMYDPSQLGVPKIEDLENAIESLKLKKRKSLNIDDFQNDE